MYLIDKNDEDCNYFNQNIEESYFKNIRLLQNSKYIYCPKELQSNHRLPQFTIKLECFIIDLLNKELNEFNDNLNENDQLKEMNIEKNLDEIIIIHSWIKTILNYRVHFKTIKFRTFTKSIRIELNLLDKFKLDDLFEIKSLELEIKLTNGFKENLSFKFNKKQKLNQFQLKLNKQEIYQNDLLKLNIESTFRFIENTFFLIQISNGQLLDVQIMNNKNKQIKIKENMFPNLDLILLTKLDNKLIYTRKSIKIKKQSTIKSSTNQLYTSFKQIKNDKNNKKLIIKLLSTNSSFIHIRSLKKDLSKFEENLDLILNKDSNHNCLTIDELFYKCIDYYKFNEIIDKPEMNHDESLTNEIDNLFLNQTNKPFYFNLFFYSKFKLFLNFF